MNIIIAIINSIISIFTILVFIYSLLGYFLDPFHPVRQAIGQVVEPMLAPIRKLIPTAGGLDFSPLILIILLQVIGSVLLTILRNL